jgi:hypothetical protein
MTSRKLGGEKRTSEAAFRKSVERDRAATDARHAAMAAEGRKALQDARHRSYGLGPLWIVTRATATSTLDDILFKASPHDLALQVMGGLRPDEILGWFDSYTETNQNALQELYRAGATS